MRKTNDFMRIITISLSVALMIVAVKAVDILQDFQGDMVVEGDIIIMDFNSDICLTLTPVMSVENPAIRASS